MIKLIIVAGLFLVSCQLGPTKVVQQQDIQSAKISAKKLLEGPAVILDVRAPFEFNLSHVPGAINVRWEDFSQAQDRYKGLLQKDLFSMARRLALVGIDPNTRVILLGKGSAGLGEEGRVAWTLKVLGVREVHTLVHTSYREMNALSEAPPIKNKSYWMPQVDEDLDVDPKKFKIEIKKNKPETFVIDVRSPQEFALGSRKEIKKIKSLIHNISWDRFFDEQGSPRGGIEADLQRLGITKDSSVFLISNRGVRSGAVTYALDSLGYKNVSNVSGGYQLVSP